MDPRKRTNAATVDDKDPSGRVNEIKLFEHRRCLSQRGGRVFN